MITTTAHAKCILTGEHAVLRGQPALVLPLTKKTLTLTSLPQQTESIRTARSLPSSLEKTLMAFFQHAQETLNLHTEAPWGSVSIESTIPPGVGLGFSAAFCVAFARLLVELECISPQDTFETAHILEHFFHGKSSGLDIAGVLHDQPILYDPPHMTPLHNEWFPNLIILDSAQQNSTANSIDQVQQEHTQNPDRAKEIDERMGQSTALASQAWNEKNTEKLVESITIAEYCFEHWNLIPPSQAQQIEQLKQQGALAVKPTGAGNGGCILALLPDALTLPNATPLFT